MARYPGLTLRILRGRVPAMGPGRAELLERIDSTGSISAAARAMGMSYKRAWQLIESVNGAFATPLVVKEAGGTRGGGAKLTPQGRQALALFRKMESKASTSIAADLKRYSALLKRGRG